jgi:cytochrome P450
VPLGEKCQSPWAGSPVIAAQSGDEPDQHGARFTARCAEQLDLVRHDPAALAAAVNEVARWESPLQFAPRMATRDTELAGVRIPSGSTVMVLLGAANRDPARWEDPDRFDLRRPYHSTLAFGHGAHRCVGMHLSKMETEVMVDAVLNTLPGLRLDDGFPAPQIEGTLMRSPGELKVIWDT